MTDTTAPRTAAPETFGAHKPHANDPETQVRRVLACVKCGDRHTVDVAEVQREAIEPLLALVRAAQELVRYEEQHPISGGWAARVGGLAFKIDALPESVRVAARKP